MRHRLDNLSNISAANRVYEAARAAAIDEQRRRAWSVSDDDLLDIDCESLKHEALRLIAAWELDHGHIVSWAL